MDQYRDNWQVIFRAIVVYWQTTIVPLPFPTPFSYLCLYPNGSAIYLQQRVKTKGSDCLPRQFFTMK